MPGYLTFIPSSPESESHKEAENMPFAKLLLVLSALAIVSLTPTPSVPTGQGSDTTAAVATTGTTPADTPWPDCCAAV
jgi:hypothetical protein